MGAVNVGDKFGRLAVLCEAAKPKGRKGAFWWCHCDCGNEARVWQHSLLTGTQSCGCLQREKAAMQGSASKKDRMGERVGRLVVIAPAEPNGRVRWKCRCDCGNVVDVRSSDLRPGRTTSCGCLRRETSARIGRETTKHGHAKHDKVTDRVLTTPEYRSWRSMKNRVLLPSMPNYHLYGGRGITICERWLDPETGFQNFLADMGNRPEGKTLDRIDVDGNYEPSNCRWADPKEQSRNRRETEEYKASRKATLDRGREKMWSDPEIRARLLASRRRKKA